jgi:putative kinase
VALDQIDPYPWFLNKKLDLVVNEQLMHTRISASEWMESWRPLLGKLYDSWTAHQPKRYLIAIAGPPGSGKSVFAAQLHYIIDKGVLHKDAHAIALPMDGFHFPNSYLQSHALRLPDGKEVRLSALKGQPETFDIARLRKYMQALIARPENVPWPGYSRASHDVVPDKFRVHAGINLVIVEGNYLLVNRGQFAGLPEMFDLRMYVETPAPNIIANLVERHIKGGKTLDEAKDWVKRIDLPNARLAESSQHQADVIVERDADDDIASIAWKGEGVISIKPVPAGGGNAGGGTGGAATPPAAAS